MKKLVFHLTLALIAFAINADYHDPNFYFDQDSKRVGAHYVYASASETYVEWADTYWYYASAIASYSIAGDAGEFGDAAYWSLTVEATPMESDSDSGVTWPGSFRHLAATGGKMFTKSYASSYSSMGPTCVYAGI